MISDSAWTHQIKKRSRDEKAKERFKGKENDDDVETNLWYFLLRGYKTFWLQIMILTTIENIIFLYWSAFELSKDTNISYYDASCLFASMCVLMFTRWVFIIHWALPTHFHKANAVEN